MSNDLSQKNQLFRKWFFKIWFRMTSFLFFAWFGSSNVWGYNLNQNLISSKPCVKAPGWQLYLSLSLRLISHNFTWPPNFILMVKLRNWFKAFELSIQVERKIIPRQCRWTYQQLVHANYKFSQNMQCLFQFKTQCEVAIWPHIETPNPKLHPLQLCCADYVSPMLTDQIHTYCSFFLSSSRSTLDFKLQFRAGRCGWPISFRQQLR